MIFNNFSDFKKKDYQVLIFGSGPAGISLALKLEKKKISSLIIEAGSEEYDNLSQEDYNATFFGDEITDLRYSRLRQFGGTSGHWGGWCKPMEEWNFNKANLDFTNLKSYFSEASSILNIDSKFNKIELNEYFNQIQFQFSNVRFAEKYRDHISNSKFIDLALNSQLSHFDGENGTKIFGANIISNNQNFLIKAKFYILACGGVENSRILLWSKEKNPKLIDSRIPVGKYWMTHPWFLGGSGFIKKKEIQDLLKEKFLDWDTHFHIATNQNFVIDKESLSASLWMSFDENQKRHEEIIKSFLCISPSYGKKIARMLLNKDLKCGDIYLQMEEEPNDTNRVILDKKIKDSNGIPVSNIQYKKSKKTIISAKKILESLAEYFIQKDIGRIAINQEIQSLENYENIAVHHHMGGTRIGNNIKTSVVDKNLKLHGLENLYIAGSSVFTNGGFSNPTYTIVLLSLKLGDTITQKLI